MTIGIPKALLYWKRPYFWENFFEELGLKVLLSSYTNREIAESGIKASDPETCFANKIFWGHLLWLDGKCDYIFVPRLKTNEDKLEYCPKFFGVPDLAKILVKTPILTETFDERKEKFERTIQRLGKKIKKSKEEVKKATRTAFLKEKELGEKEKEGFFGRIQSEKPKIILVSHPYNLYDDYVNLKIKEKLEKLGIEVIFIDKVPTNEIQNPKGARQGGWVAGGLESKIQNLDWPKFHWEFGEEMMGKSDEILNYNIAGVVQISSFQCGCDAVLKEFVEKKFKQNKIPFLYLIIDEQTGEAGLQTRLEAFVDTLL